MLVITCTSNTLAETYIKGPVNMTTVILVKKGNQVQEEIERRVHKLICTYSLSPVPERQKKRDERREMEKEKKEEGRQWRVRKIVVQVERSVIQW